MRWFLALAPFFFLPPAAIATEPAVVRYVEEGEQLLSEGRLQDAIHAYERAQDAGAGSALFLNRLGMLYLRAEAYDRAAAAYKLSLREKPDQLPVYSRLGEAYLAAGMPDSALRYVRQARMLAPAGSGIHGSLAFLLLQRGDETLGDLEAARAHLDTALQLSPENPEMYRYLGYYYTQKDSIGRAIEAYERVADLAPEDFEAFNNLGFLHLAREDYAKALEYYTLARGRAQEPHLVHAVDERIEAARAMLDGSMRARYILVHSKAKAVDLLQRINQGADLSRLIARHSEAPNAQAGGETGFFGPGDLLPAFERAVMDLKVGEVGEVLELEMGYFIIQRLN